VRARSWHVLSQVVESGKGFAAVAIEVDIASNRAEPRRKVDVNIMLKLFVCGVDLLRLVRRSIDLYKCLTHELTPRLRGHVNYQPHSGYLHIYELLSFESNDKFTIMITGCWLTAQYDGHWRSATPQIPHEFTTT
jgi:hypothetical protein